MSLSDDSSVEEVAVVSFEEGRERRLREAEAQNEVIDLADDQEDRQKCLLLVSLPAEITDRFKAVGYIEWLDDLLPLFEAGPSDIKRLCRQSEKADKKIRHCEDQQQVHVDEKGKNNEARSRSSRASPSSPAMAGEGQESSVKDNTTEPHASTCSTSTTTVRKKINNTSRTSKAKSAKTSRAKTSTSKTSTTKDTSKSSKTSRPSKKASKSKAKASASSTPIGGDQTGPQQSPAVANKRKGKKPTAGESISSSSSLSSSSDESESDNDSLSPCQEVVRRRNARKTSPQKPSNATGLSEEAPSAPSSSTSKGRQSRKRKNVTKATGKSQARVVSPGGGVKERATSRTKRVKQHGQCSVSTKARKNGAKRKKESLASKGKVPRSKSRRGVAKDSYAEIGSSDIDSDYV